MARTAVTNSSPLILLGRIDRLGLLQLAFDRVLAPRAVETEVGEVPGFVEVCDVTDQPLLRSLMIRMDVGEAEVLTLAANEPGAMAILDDWKGRRAAARLGITHVGTVGLLLHLKALGRLEQVEPLIRGLMSAGMYLGEEIVLRALREAGER